MRWWAVRCALLLLLLSVAGCSGVSREWRVKAKPRISFEELLQHPDRFKGRVVIFGGYIIRTDNLADRTRILVLQAPLDMEDAPGSRDRSKGRFLVEKTGFLDPEVYRAGRRVTVAGRVSGTAREAVGKKIVRCPVLEAGEIVLWPETPPGEREWEYGPFLPFYWWDVPPFYCP